MSLEERLLSIGGTTVIMPECIPDIIEKYGHLYNLPVDIVTEKTSVYYLKNENSIRVAWGFALLHGIWTIHSWLISQRDACIIDNLKYDEYFGFVKPEIS